MKNKILMLLSLLAIIFTLMACKAERIAGAKEGVVDPLNKKILTVTMFNVGKADAMLLQIDGKSVVIDTGLYDNAQDLIKSLRNKGVKKIDQLYMTHPHADHIGGVLPILNSISTKTIYDTGIINPKSKLYPLIIKKAKEKNIEIKKVNAPSVINITPEAKFEILSPTEKDVVASNPDNDPNVNSLVMRLVYKNFTMMFTADSYKESEYNIMKTYRADKLKADVLKVAHHTSNSSTSYEWLKVVSPEVAIASYGNKPGVEYDKYPNKKTLRRIKSQNIKFYGTEKNGNITIATDGKIFNVKTERGTAQ